MKTRIMIRYSVAISILLIGTFISDSSAAVISWDASSNLTPDQVGFELVNTSVPETPTLDNSILTISNNSSAETMYYIMRDPPVPLLFPEIFEASFRMRYVSGSYISTGRRSAGVTVALAPNIGCSFFIGNDTIFLTAGSLFIEGPTAVVDTNDSFHDYLLRIEGNAVTVYQDGNEVLSGNTFYSPQDIGAFPRVAFGDFTGRAEGISEWKSFSHNAIPEPSSIAMIGLIGGCCVFVRRFFIV